MPQNLDSRLFDHPPLFVFPSCRWQRERVPKCLCEACNHSGVVAREVVQLDRFRNAVIRLRLARSANKNLVVVLSRVLQLEQ